MFSPRRARLSRVVATIAVAAACTLAGEAPARAQGKSTTTRIGAIEDPDVRVRSVQLAYRTGSTGKFVTVAGTYSLGQFRIQIPGLAVKASLIEDYLQAVDKSGLPLTSRGDAATPLRVVVPSNGVLTSPFFWVPVGGAILTAVLLTSSSPITSSNTATVTIGVKE